MTQPHKRINVLYISGLGDKYDWFRRVSLKLWAIWGVDAELVPMRWYDGGSYEEKWSRLKDAVEAAKANKQSVVVLGESAGGSMALRAAAELPVDILATVSGIASANTPISPAIFSKSPAFKEAIDRIQNARAMLVANRTPQTIQFVGMFDTVVPPSKNKLPHAKYVTLPSFGHLFTNIAALTVCSAAIVLQIRRIIK